MNNDFLVAIIGFCVCAWLSFKIIESLKSIFGSFESIRKQNIDISKWKKIKGKILKKGFNLDYVYKDAEYDEIKSFIGGASFEDVILNQEMAKYYRDTSNGIMIYYGYIYEGNKYFSREIGFFPMDSDIDLFYKVAKGDIVDIFVNQNNPEDSYLRLTPDEVISRYEWNQTKRLIPHLSFTIIMWFLLAFGIFQML